MKRPHLSLVTSNPSKAEAATARQSLVKKEHVPFNYQLSLPLNTDSDYARSVFIVSMDTVHGSDLCKFIEEKKPRLALDLRILVRFDLPGASRDKIFASLRNSHSFYLKAPLNWSQFKVSNFIMDESFLSQQLFHEVLERDTTPIFILTSKPEESVALGSYLNRILSQHEKRPWVVERLS